MTGQTEDTEQKSPSSENNSLAFNVPKIKDKHGKGSTSLTFSFLAFNLVCLWLVLWILLTPLGFNVPPFDASEAALFLTPILALYFGRSHDKEKYPQDSPQNNK